MRLAITVRIFVVVVCLLATAMASAQTPPGSAMTPKLCEKEARAYVGKKNTDASAKPDESDELRLKDRRDFNWNFVDSHYDSRANTCYVMYERFPSQDPPGSRIHSYMEELEIAEVRATDSKIAWLYTSCVLSRDGSSSECMNPDQCEVNGKGCESKQEFIELVQKWMPAFKPFDKQPRF